MSIKDAMSDYLMADSGITGLVDLRIYPQLAPGDSTGLLTLSANVADGDTVTLDTKVYTFQTSLTNTNGNVLIGATANDSIDNLIAAIELGAGSGTKYAALTTVHDSVYAERVVTSTMSVIAHDGSNKAFATTEVSDTASWGAAAMRVYPYIVLSRISAIHGRHATAADGLVRADLQIDSFDVTSPKVETLADLLRVKLHGTQQLTIGTPTVSVRAITMTLERDDIDPPKGGRDERVFRTMQEYSIVHAA